MKAILAGFGLTAAVLAGCVPPPQGMAPYPPTAQAAAAPAGHALPDEPEPKPMPPSDVRQMKCTTLNSASDDDKAYASTFLLGYRSAMVHSHVLDTKQVDAIVQAAVAECAARPDANAYKVFATAQIKAAMAERAAAPHYPHHRMSATPAAAPATTPAEPAQSPALHYTPSPATPMEPGSPSKPAEDKAATAPAVPDRRVPGAPTDTAPAMSKPAESAPDAARPAETMPAKPAAADSSTSAPPAVEPAPAQPTPTDGSAPAPSSGGSRQ
jgi:hypothetical protein